MAVLFAPPSPSQNRKQKEYVNGIIREFLIEYSADFLRSMYLNAHDRKLLYRISGAELSGQLEEISLNNACI